MLASYMHYVLEPKEPAAHFDTTTACKLNEDVLLSTSSHSNKIDKALEQSGSFHSSLE